MTEWVLNPLEISFVGFENSYEMTHRSKYGNNPWKEQKERLFLIKLEKYPKELFALGR